MGQCSASVGMARWQWRAPWLGVAALALTACGDIAKLPAAAGTHSHREHRARQGLAAGGSGSLGLASSASTTLPARFAADDVGNAIWRVTAQH